MISICIATYNGEKFIYEQLMSILCQLCEDDEIVISDDGSIDNTFRIISEINDKRIKTILNTNRHGIVPNFENALNHSSGDIIFLSDQDDVWSPNKVQVCLKELSQSDLVVHDSIIVDENGMPIGKNFFKIRNSGPGYLKNLYKNSFVGSCMAFHRNILRYILPFPKNILWHDMWIGLMVEKYGKTKFIDEKLINYRRHKQNASATSESSTFSKFFMLKYRMQMLYYTSIR